jgi:CRP/FNR family nitrogen fixation transcriptional regulator
LALVFAKAASTHSDQEALMKQACTGSAQQDPAPPLGRPYPLSALDPLAVKTRYHRGQEVGGSTRPAEYWYRVVSGAARRAAVRADGRRQIVDLLLPGDFFGFTDREQDDFTIEAAGEGTVVACYPRRRVEALADANPKLAREILQVSFDALSRLQAQLLIVGRVTAVEKVGSFLLEIAARSGSSADRVVLPISRYDIADYLAVSVETVSRSLTDLKQRGVIAFSGTRQVRIVNREALEDGDFYSSRTDRRRIPTVSGARLAGGMC